MANFSKKLLVFKNYNTCCPSHKLILVGNIISWESECMEISYNGYFLNKTRVSKNKKNEILLLMLSNFIFIINNLRKKQGAI